MQKHRPLCRWGNGAPIKRDQIQEILEQVARDEGLPAERVRSRSLRIGGATALCHVYGDVELIKRYDRWASTSFHSCLWESNEGAQGVAAKMASDKTSLHVGYRL